MAGLRWHWLGIADLGPVQWAVLGWMGLFVWVDMVGGNKAKFGLGVVSYIGFGSVLDQITSVGRGSLIGLPPEFKQILGLLRIGEVFTMYSSTVSIKMMYQYGLSNGTIKRMRYR